MRHYLRIWKRSVVASSNGIYAAAEPQTIQGCLRPGRVGVVTIVNLVLLLLATPALAQNTGQYDHCVRSLPFLTSVATQIDTEDIEAVVYDRHCKDGAVRAGLETQGSAGIPIQGIPAQFAGGLFASYGSKERFCKTQYEQRGEQRLRVTANSTVASMAFGAYIECLRLASGGFAISPTGPSGGTLINVSIKKTSSDTETLQTVATAGMEGCVLSGESLEEGINHVSIEVTGNDNLPLICRRSSQEVGEAELLFDPGEITIQTSVGASSFYFRPDRRLATQTALGLKEEFSQQLEEIKRELENARAEEAANARRDNCRWIEVYVTKRGHAPTCSSGEYLAGIKQKFADGSWRTFVKEIYCCPARLFPESSG